jgi:Kelch motif
MVRYLMLIAVYGICSCSGQDNKVQEKATLDQRDSVQSKYVWEKVTDSADFPKSYNFQLMSIRDTLWALHPRGNWYSTDGKSWNLSSLSNAINNLAFLDYILFRDTLIGLGYFDGNIERFSFFPKVSHTANMREWKVRSKQSQLPGRFFYHPFVWNDRMWIIGGMDGHKSYQDIWSSPDAVHWEKEKDKLPFGERESQQFVILKDKIFMLGNDVWSSSDALQWKRVTDEIIPGQKIFGYAALLYDEKIWLLGCTRNNQFTSKVLYSEDGKTWTEMDAPWSPRGGIAACVYQGNIYMTGGKYGGTPDHTEFIYSNDVWRLKKTSN